MSIFPRNLLTMATCLALFLAPFAANHTIAAISETATASPVERTNSQGPVRVTTQVDRHSAQIAEPIRLTVTAHAAAGVRVSFPKASDRLGDFDVIGANDQFDIPVANGRTSTREYVLESLTAGKHAIPAIDITYVDTRSTNQAQQPAQQVVKSRPVEIAITSLLEGKTDPTKFRDIKGIVEVAPPKPASHRLLIGVLAAVLLAGGGLAALYYLKKERQLSAGEWAIQELDRLAEARRADQMNAQAFYIQVTDIVRRFAERRFHIAVPRLTTAEFFERVKQNQQLASSLKPLESFLATADMVKFAGVQPHANHCDAAIAKARQFIEASAAVDNDATTAETSSATPMKETA